MIKASAAFAGVAIVNPVAFGGTSIRNDQDPIPSYLKGYEELYAEDPRKAALQYFWDAKFGLFIHYGLYSLLEGFWKGNHSRPAEWVQLRGKIRVEEYEKLASQFTAEKFDADFITDLALEAGMKYINLTTRHHDSFCLFDSKYTDFKTTNSAAQRDLVGELSDSCQQKGLGLFLYYSHGRDWRHPHAPNNDEWGGAARPAYDPPEESYKYGDEHDLGIYVEFMKNQVTELLTNYGPVAGIWLDGLGVPRSRPEKVHEFKLQELYDHIHSLQPQVLVSYKQGLLGTEDFKAPERHFEGTSEVPLEICNTLQPYSWGFDRKDDEGHKTADEVMDMLAHSRKTGANLLLNTGPLPDGSIHPDDIKTLKEAGRRLRSGLFFAGCNVCREAWMSLCIPAASRYLYRYINPEPGLPKVFIYGDSISIGYTEYVRASLEGKTCVYRLHENGGSSNEFIRKMETLRKAMFQPDLKDGWDFEWNVIHFNVGLHDLKYVVDRKLDKENGTQVSSLDTYENNLRSIINYLKDTYPNAKLIFATTTTVPEGEPGRIAGDDMQYNKVALKVLEDHKDVIINDLHGFSIPVLEKYATRPGNVHFKDEGSRLLGIEVARVIGNSVGIKPVECPSVDIIKERSRIYEGRKSENK